MRLDKFLKVSRLIKRRSVAKEVADQGRIDINGITAKSSSTVKEGDQLTIHYGNRTLVADIVRILDTTKKEDAARMYNIVSEERVQDTNTFTPYD